MCVNVYITRFTTILLHRAHAGGIWHTYHLLCLQICKGIEKYLRYRVQVQGVYHQSKYTKFLPPRVCIACCAVLRFKSQPISLLPFHLSRPSVGKNSDNHHNVKTSQGAKVLFYNLVILNPWLYFRSPVKGSKHQITEECHHHVFLLWSICTRCCSERSRNIYSLQPSIDCGTVVYCIPNTPLYTATATGTQEIWRNLLFSTPPPVLGIHYLQCDNKSHRSMGPCKLLGCLWCCMFRIGFKNFWHNQQFCQVFLDL